MPILQNILALILAGAGSIAVPQAGPQLDLDPDRAHIWILAPSHWNLEFYGRSDLSGDPVVELTDEGLRIDGRVVCPWPGGRWDEGRKMNMVLGYTSVDAGVYRPCVPPGLPLISTWSDSGLGHGSRVGAVRVGSRG